MPNDLTDEEREAYADLAKAAARLRRAQAAKRESAEAAEAGKVQA